KRTCKPVDEAMKFLRRYTDDTVRRIREFAAIRSDQPVEVIHGDARIVDLPLEPSGVITSPPYPGLIDYHEQHRYSYELLRLEDRRELELGAAAAGTSRAALATYSQGIVDVLASVRQVLRRRALVAIVVNDRRDLYPEILERA